MADLDTSLLPSAAPRPRGFRWVPMLATGFLACAGILCFAGVPTGRVSLGRRVPPSLQAASRPAEHFWPQRGGNPRMNSNVPWTAQRDFSRAPTWNWSNPLNEQVRHSPLIDRNSDVYISTDQRVRKFCGLSGALLWTWESPTAQDGEAHMSACPSLYGDALLAVLGGTASVIVYSLDLATGTVNWRREHAVRQLGDATATLAYNGTLIFAIEDPSYPSATPPGPADGNRMVMAVNASGGDQLWDFAISGVVWNFSPATSGDGTFLFATSCGVAYRLDYGGRLLWKVGHGPDIDCSAGGGALSPDGSMFYISWSHFIVDFLPGNNFAALRVSDGTVLWRKTITYGNAFPSAQYPAVGRLGRDGPLAVVVSVGDQPMLPAQMMPPSAVAMLANVSGSAPMLNQVVAMDAATGAQLWTSKEAPWPHIEGAGDNMRNITQRSKEPRVQPSCLPDAQGIPVISGDGTVYASSSHSGDLRAIRVANQNGRVQVAAVSTFHPGYCFLNSPSVAPGLLVAAPCWGPTYVWVGAE